MRLLPLTLSVVFLAGKPLLAQPRVEFIRHYDNGQHEKFYDTYATSDGGYVLCGITDDSPTLYQSGDLFLVRIDEAGEVIWRRTFDAEPGYASSVIETDEGDYIFGSRSNDQFHVLRVSVDGDLVWRHDYGERECLAVIELKNGDLVFAGKSRSFGRIICTNGDGDVNWDRSYEQIRNSKLTAIRETDDGLVAVGDGYPVGVNRKYAWIIKVEAENGDLIWSNHYTDIPQFSVFGMTSAGDGGFVICGNWSGNESGPALMKVDRRGNEVWRRDFVEQISRRVVLNGVIRMPDGGFAAAGLQYLINDEGGHHRPIALRTNDEGILRWDVAYEIEVDEQFQFANNHFYSLVRNQHNELIAVGSVQMAEPDSTYDGLLMKLEPDLLGPRFIRISPDDTVMSALINEERVFIAVAESPYFEELDYYWTLDDTTIGINVQDDTLAIASLDSLGEHIVQCRVSDEDAVISVRWHVTVTDLFIAAHSPDTLDLTLRRGSSVDFSIDSVAAVEGDDVQYQWTVNDLDRQEETGAGTEPRATVEFDRSGHYMVEGMAYRGDSHDEVVWDVEVRGAIWSFLPEELNVERLEGDNVEFQIIPTISDTLNWYTWLYDGGMIREGRDSVFVMNLFELGEHTVTGILADSVESDTVNWTVLVESNSVPPSLSLEPLALSLSATPNPFNSTLTIRFQSDESIKSVVRLSAYDLSGREVARLLDSKSEIRNQKSEIVWNASGVPAGVYLVRLWQGDQISTKKVVLLR